MKILIVHQNFPGQFLHLAPALVEHGHEVHALVLKKEVPPQWSGVTLHAYQPTKGTAPTVHPWALDLETKIIRAESVFRKCLALREQGFSPDVVLAHPGWGESLFIKDVWPKTKLGIYCELNYSESGNDVGFDPEFKSTDPGDSCRLRLKNINNVMHFDLADGAISPTHFQADTIPWPFRSKIKVFHDGIDSKLIAPDPAAKFQINATTVVSRADEVITFANRNLEPYRGYHVFMRALPRLLKERPNAQVIIVGGDGLGAERLCTGTRLVRVGDRCITDGKTVFRLGQCLVHGLLLLRNQGQALLGQHHIEITLCGLQHPVLLRQLPLVFARLRGDVQLCALGLAFGVVQRLSGAQGPACGRAAVDRGAKARARQGR